MVRVNSRKAFWIAIGLAILTLVLVQWRTLPAQVAPVEPGLVDLQTIEALRERFNQDQGSSRLIMLLSPT